MGVPFLDSLGTKREAPWRVEQQSLGFEYIMGGLLFVYASVSPPVTWEGKVG